MLPKSTFFTARENLILLQDLLIILFHPVNLVCSWEARDYKLTTMEIHHIIQTTYDLAQLDII